MKTILCAVIVAVLQAACGKEASGECLCTPAELFDTVATNTLSSTHDHIVYSRWYRAFADFDGDGLEDVLVSEPMEHAGMGHTVFTMYLATNGLYRKAATIGGQAGNIYVEEDSRAGCRCTWSYLRSSSRTGLIEQTVVNGSGNVRQTHLDVSISEDGNSESCTGDVLLNSIKKLATVPIRWEVSTTVNGVTSWITIEEYGKEILERHRRAREAAIGRSKK